MAQLASTANDSLETLRTYHALLQHLKDLKGCKVLTNSHTAKVASPLFFVLVTSKVGNRSVYNAYSASNTEFENLRYQSMRNLTCLWCKGDQARSVSQRWREDSPNSSSHSSSKTMMPFSKDFDSGFSVPLGSACTSASEKDLHRSASFQANSARKLTWLTSGLSRPCFAWHGCFNMRKWESLKRILGKREKQDSKNHQNDVYSMTVHTVYISIQIKAWRMWTCSLEKNMKTSLVFTKWCEWLGRPFCYAALLIYADPDMLISQGMAVRKRCI